MSDRDAVLIAGGGIGGLATAVALLRAGIEVRVFERAEALEEVGAGVSLWPNALRALAHLDLDRAVRRGHVSLEEIVVRDRGGRPLLRLRSPGDHREPGICVHRGHLQGVLAAAVPSDRLHLGRHVTAFEADGEGVTLHLSGGGRARGRLLIGCDGIRSTVRSSLHGPARPRFRGYRIWRGVARLTLDGDLATRSTEWWGPGRRFGVLPGEPGRVYWYATRTTRDRRAPEPVDPHGLRALFARWPPLVEELMAASGESDIVRTLAEDRPVPHPWGRGPVTLLGDAAHAMTPNMGQGACTALEDAVVLARCLAREGTTPGALRRYERLRGPRVRRIVRQSRRIGRIAQVRSPLLGGARNAVMRVLPGRLVDAAQRGVYAYDAPGTPLD